MLGAYVLAVALACAGMERIGNDSSYITVEPPAEGQRACIYDREPGGSWTIWMDAFDYDLSGPLCAAVYPGMEFGRIDVEHGAFCPPKPEALEPIEVRIKEPL